MRMLTVLSVIALLALVCGNVNDKESKWFERPQIVVSKKNDVEFKKDEDEETSARKNHRENHKHHDGNRRIPQRRLNFKKTDALPYSSPYSRPYDWSMYTDGPFGWGPSRKRREKNSFNEFKRSLSAQNYAPQYSNQQRAAPQPAQQVAYAQPAQHAAYVQPAQRAPYAQPAQQPYNYQAAASRNTLTQTGSRSPNSPQILRKKAPKVQQPQERTWVDKLGVTWTTRKVNDYKWGERMPGITMDEYAGGPFGFDDVKRNEIARANLRQWQRRSSIPPRPSSRPSLQRRSWIDKYGVTWTMDHVNDYKWGEREPGISMDQYNGGPYGWNNVKRDRISIPSRIATPRNMYMDKP